MALGVGLSVDPQLAATLDEGRSPATPRRSASVAVGASLRDATVIAAIRGDESEVAGGASPVRFYRVHVVPTHTAPLAILEELRERMQAGGALDPLIREYWQPTGVWHIKEVLAGSLLVIAQVPAVSDREAYVPRWVLYRADRERARSF